MSALWELEPYANSIVYPARQKKVFRECQNQAEYFAKQLFNPGARALSFSFASAPHYKLIFPKLHTATRRLTVQKANAKKCSPQSLFRRRWSSTAAAYINTSDFKNLPLPTLDKSCLPQKLCSKLIPATARLSGAHCCGRTSEFFSSFSLRHFFATRILFDQFTSERRRKSFVFCCRRACLSARCIPLGTASQSKQTSLISDEGPRENRFRATDSNHTRDREAPLGTGSTFYVSPGPKDWGF